MGQVQVMHLYPGCRTVLRQKSSFLWLPSWERSYSNPPTVCVMVCISVRISVTSVLSNSATLWTVACQAPPGKNTGVGCYAGLPPPGDLPNPGQNPDLLHWRQILYQLSHQGSQTRLCTRREMTRALGLTPKVTGLRRSCTEHFSMMPLFTGLG